MTFMPDLPDGWRTRRLKYVATCNDDVLPESTDEFEELRYVEISGVSLTGGIENTADVYFHEAPSRARRRVKSGDILISTVRTYLKAIAAIPNAEPNLIASTGFCVVRPRAETDSGYLGWVAKSEPFVAEIVARSTGVSYPAIKPSELATLDVPLPPLETQRRIARFLDAKTARIDALITKKRALLERLAEKRQALITQAATKGVDPNAPMKDSGIEWLGKIPAHWNMTRLRFLIDGGTRNGLYKPKESFSEDGIPFVQMGEAFRGPLFVGGTEDRVVADVGELEKWSLRRGDFLIARRSLVFDGSGKSVMVGDLDEDHLFESSMIRLRPLQSACPSEFLCYYFQSALGRAFILSITKQVTISGIDSQQLKDFPVAFPNSVTECRAIAHFCQKQDSATREAERKIAASVVQLQEYRASIITAAVTGQLEVAAAHHNVRAGEQVGKLTTEVT